MNNYVRCKICGSRINVDTGYEYISCACGAIAVDGGPEYTRIIGQLENYEVVSNKDSVSIGENDD